MRLYNKAGDVPQIDDPVYGTIKPDETGGFSMPEALYDQLHGRPEWENDAEREARIVKEQLDIARDPATLLKEVRTLGTNQGALIAALVKALGVDPAPVVTDAAPAPEAKAADEPATPTAAKSTRGRGKTGAQGAE
jgi:hypothetical protein